MKSQAGPWPNPQQELLLRAALLEGEAALSAWQQWQAEADLDHLDYGSFRLLPLLYQNLQRHQIKHPWLPTLKGIHRRTWYQNQLRLQSLLR